VKIFLEIAFISNQSPELAGFPSLFDWIKCCIVKEAVDVPMWITQPVDRSRIPMEELRIQQLARSTILVQASLPDLALHLGFHGAHRFIHSRSGDILNHLIACTLTLRLRPSDSLPTLCVDLPSREVRKVTGDNSSTHFNVVSTSRVESRSKALRAEKR
jgi:hypothetical protein